MTRFWPPGGATLISAAPLTNPPRLHASRPVHPTTLPRSAAWGSTVRGSSTRHRSDWRNASAVAVSTRERVMAGQPQAAPLLELAERAERLGFDSVFEVSWSRINLNAFLAAGGQALSESRRQAAMSLRAQPVAR